MTLYHITHRDNQASIDAVGLDPSRATHKEKAVWLVAKSNVMWALGHTAAKPGRGAIRDLVVYTCDVPRSKLRRYKRGIWRTFETVRPASITSSATYTDAYPN